MLLRQLTLIALAAAPALVSAGFDDIVYATSDAQSADTHYIEVQENKCLPLEDSDRTGDNGSRFWINKSKIMCTLYVDTECKDSAQGKDAVIMSNAMERGGPEYTIGSGYRAYPWDGFEGTFRAIMCVEDCMVKYGAAACYEMDKEKNG